MGPGVGWDGVEGESFSAYLMPMGPALPLACDSFPKAQLCPGQAGSLCSGMGCTGSPPQSWSPL